MSQYYSRKVAHQAKRKQVFGTICCNCGKNCGEKIEYHHIVPLERGGQDVESNLAPLCYECHSLVHFPFERKKPERTGRRRKEYDDDLLNNVFVLYTTKQITETEAKRRLGTGCHIKDMIQFNEWAEKNGIDPHQQFGRSGRWYK